MYIRPLRLVQSMEVIAVAVQKLYELREVADIIGLTLGSVRQYVARGVIPALHLGRKRVVRADVLEKICTEGLRTKKENTGTA
jgi:hypothetical protein